MKLSRYDRIMAIARHPEYVKDFILFAKAPTENKKSSKVYSEEQLSVLSKLSLKWTVEHPPFPFTKGNNVREVYPDLNEDKAATEISSDARPEGNPFSKNKSNKDNVLTNLYNALSITQDTDNHVDRYRNYLYLHLKIDLSKNRKEILAAIADILKPWINEDNKQKGRKTKIDPWELFDKVNMRFPLSFSKYEIIPNLSSVRKKYKDDKKISSARWDRLDSAYEKALKMIKAVTPKSSKVFQPK